MKRFVLVIACAAWASSAGLAQADDSDLKAMDAAGKAFVAAYNAKDAKTLATMWTENADYKDDTGLDLHGRDAIQRAFAAQFAEHPDWKLELHVESSRLVTPTSRLNRPIITDEANAAVHSRAGKAATAGTAAPKTKAETADSGAKEAPA